MLHVVWQSQEMGLILLTVGLVCVVEARIFYGVEGKPWKTYKPGMAIGGIFLSLFIVWIKTCK
jgi:hypothetical protein